MGSASSAQEEERGMAHTRRAAHPQHARCESALAGSGVSSQVQCANQHRNMVIKNNINFFILCFYPGDETRPMDETRDKQKSA